MSINYNVLYKSSTKFYTVVGERVDVDKIVVEYKE